MVTWGDVVRGHCGGPIKWVVVTQSGVISGHFGGVVRGYTGSAVCGHSGSGRVTVVVWCSSVTLMVCAVSHMVVSGTWGSDFPPISLYWYPMLFFSLIFVLSCCHLVPMLP